MSHVIAAVSTGNQISAIGILRLTGDGCAQIAGSVFTCKNGLPLCEAPNRKLILGTLQDKQGRTIDQCMAVAKETGATLEFIEDPTVATKNASVIYTDVWVSMGEPDSVWAERIAELTPYRVTKALMDNAGAQCRFMHCLPAFHDLKTTIGKQIYDKFGIDCMEVTDEVFESEQSIVFDEAENRMHTIKAIMAATL
jgi:ornithine carbamoyltransferase